MTPQYRTQLRMSLTVVVALLLFAGVGWLVRNPSAAEAALNSGSSSNAKAAAAGGVIVGQDYQHDTSPPLRDMPQVPYSPKGEKREGPENPRLLISNRADKVDQVTQKFFGPLAMPAPILNFDGIPFPGVGCNCAPPDTDGEVGATQYVQMVNEGYQVFNKTTGASVLGPNALSSIWTGFGGVCENNGGGDPVVLYDQLANRWLISQFAGTSIPTDECIAVSTTSDATGSYNRYGFHLGTNFFDYPHLGVWPDAYYMSMNIFNAAGTAFLGPQPFAFDRTRMLAGQAATFVSPGITGGPNENSYLPADFDGSILPPAGAPNTFVEFPGSGNYKTFHFQVDFAVPANSTFTLFASPPAAGFTQLCATTRACVPQLGSPDNLDGIADRLMFRLAYRRFSDGREAVVGNYTVSSGGVAGVRWFELDNVTAGPVTKVQESTYQPDTTWRWMGSTAMDRLGDLALGYSASSSTIFPQIRYAGRLATDPPNTLAQGEATLFAGTGSQLQTGNRWGDYSDMTVDPVDDCTFWYTQEYYAATAAFAWRTRIGNFKFPQCTAATPTPTVTGTPPTATRTSTPPPTATATPTTNPCLLQNYQTTTGAATIVAGTTLVTGSNCDDCVQTVALPFAYQLYDQTYTSVTLDSNGKAHFQSGASTFNNTCLPAAFTYTIYPYWDDLLLTAAGSGIYTSVSGVMPNRIFNIEWRGGYYSAAGPTGTANFELRLYEGQTRFDVIYGTLTSLNTSATSGVQRDGTVFTQYFCNATGGAATGSVTYTLPSCNTPTRTPAPATSTRTPVPPTSTPTCVATLNGHLTYQGLAQPNAGNAQAITLKLQPTGGGTVTTYNMSTDSNGNFTVALGALPPGTYNWWLKSPRYLATAGTLTLTGACILTQEFGTQRAGDINNDGCVDVTDFSLLRATFGKACGDPGYNTTADYNNDCVVDTIDFSLLRSNFGTCGPPQPTLAGASSR